MTILEEYGLVDITTARDHAEPQTWTCGRCGAEVPGDEYHICRESPEAEYIPAAIAGYRQHTTKPPLTDDEVGRLDSLYLHMECNHRLLVHVEESTAVEQLAVNTAAASQPLSPAVFAGHLDAMRRFMRAQLAAYDAWLTERAKPQEVPA